MFFTYLWRELRRRARQATFIAVGLALGIGLVITVTAASAGVKNAQSSVLHSLYGVGTDITVTKTPTFGSGTGGTGFNFRQSFGSSNSKSSSTSVNRNMLTSDFTLASIASTEVTTVSKLKNVSAAAGGLTLTDRVISGNFGSNSTPGSTPTARPTGGYGGSGSGSSNGGSRSFSGGFNFGNSYTVEGVDLANGELGPLSTGTVSTGRTFASADAAKNVALVDSNYATSQKLKVGSTVSIGNSKGVATKFTVIGIVKDASGTTEDDVYIPLGRAQALSGLTGKINTIYVAASSGDKITTVASSIKTAVSGATVTDQDTLASQVTGSISSAASLANNLGKWLAIAVLAAAFLLASLLTMSAVSRRVREFGTLKALGWKSRRVVGQVVGESIAIGIVGGVIGVGLGFAGAWAVGKFAHPLSASLGSTTGSATPGGAQRFGAFPGGGTAPGGTGGTNPFRGAFGNAANNASSVTVHLSAPVTITVIILAVGLAVFGGLIAGGFGGWRAARLRPAAALSKVA
ncbi:ABC transporter permease [Trebonia kvetii]|uniref:ABC transporter permease n=1 Tax=Trebonia kvetii TaxID=2480626 RepID=A0A6P2C5C6_9ACTN|nr:FtsX-like permease family protein [Trebonia kvetii]TVZ06197.1 ABC transporter permease [Trebonia kvetii]